jgi:hypothetical protein
MKTCQELYLEHSFTEVMNSGRDLLGEEILKEGIPSFPRMKGILPPVDRGRYCFLSGIASWHGLLLYPDGNVYPQQTAPVAAPLPLFSPVEEDADAKLAVTEQCLLEGWIPVATIDFIIEKRFMKISYFVEYGDPDSCPQLWIDIRKKGKDRCCYVVSDSRPVKKRAINPEEYDETLETTVIEWRRLGSLFDAYALPYGEIETSLKAMTANLFATFSGDHAHYGHRVYGREIHDNFPPSYLSGIELCYSLGMKEQAFGMISHLLRFGIDIKGRFYYRQGFKDWNSASGSEYGRFFCLARRLWKTGKRIYPLDTWADVFVRMGDHLVNRIQCDEKGRRLVMMCAEADTRSRVKAYTSNNLWIVQGLRSLSLLLKDFGYSEGEKFIEAAEALYTDVRAMLNEEKIDSPWGPLVPFQSGYTPRPLTLSFCGDVPDAVPPDSYFNQLNFDSTREIEQDYSQNTYANYRYYAEMLSSGLLEPEEALAIEKMRKDLGGELLGMTRLYKRLDDWPADNYARYYLETDRLDKFLLLYYAHYLYHGNPDMGVYYEQVTADGEVFAPDCVPSLTLTPLMTAWMFCYQKPAGDEVYLLRGLPPDWLTCGRPIEARHLTCTAGAIDIRITSLPGGLKVELKTAKPWKDEEVYLDLHMEKPPEAKDLRTSGAFAAGAGRSGRYRLTMMETSVIIEVRI